MIFIPGGTFRMGSDRHYPEEAPVHRVTVDGFWIDRTPVTNRALPRLRESHRLRHRSPRSAPDPKDYPGALPHMLHAGSLVFAPPSASVDLERLEAVVDLSRSAPTGATPTARQLDQRARRPPGRACRLRRCRSLRALGRQGPADRSRVGVRGARRARRRRIRLGRRAHARRPAHGQHLAGRVPAPEPVPPTATSAPRRSTAFPPNGYGLST